MKAKRFLNAVMRLSVLIAVLVGVSKTSLAQTQLAPQNQTQFGRLSWNPQAYGTFDNSVVGKNLTFGIYGQANSGADLNDPTTPKRGYFGFGTFGYAGNNGYIGAGGHSTYDGGLRNVGVWSLAGNASSPLMNHLAPVGGATDDTAKTLAIGLEVGAGGAHSPTGQSSGIAILVDSGDVFMSVGNATDGYNMTTVGDMRVLGTLYADANNKFVQDAALSTVQASKTKSAVVWGDKGPDVTNTNPVFEATSAATTAGGALYFGNATGTGDNLLQLQFSGDNVFNVANNGDVTVGAAAATNFTVKSATGNVNALGDLTTGALTAAGANFKIDGANGTLTIASAGGAGAGNPNFEIDGTNGSVAIASGGAALTAPNLTIDGTNGDLSIGTGGTATSATKAKISGTGTIEVAGGGVVGASAAFKVDGTTGDLTMGPVAGTAFSVTATTGVTSLTTSATVAAGAAMTIANTGAPQSPTIGQALQVTGNKQLGATSIFTNVNTGGGATMFPPLPGLVPNPAQDGYALQVIHGATIDSLEVSSQLQFNLGAVVDFTGAIVKGFSGNNHFTQDLTADRVSITSTSSAGVLIDMAQAVGPNINSALKINSAGTGSAIIDVDGTAGSTADLLNLKSGGTNAVSVVNAGNTTIAPVAAGAAADALTVTATGAGNGVKVTTTGAGDGVNVDASGGTGNGVSAKSTLLGVVGTTTVDGGVGDVASAGLKAKGAGGTGNALIIDDGGVRMPAAGKQASQTESNVAITVAAGTHSIQRNIVNTLCEATSTIIVSAKCTTNSGINGNTYVAQVYAQANGNFDVKVTCVEGDLPVAEQVDINYFIINH